MSEICEFSRLSYGGDAVGKLTGGKTVFVPRLLPGETAEIQIICEKKSFARGKLLKLLQPSPLRRQPECELFDLDCPGCSYMHCTYETELAWKQLQLEYFLRRHAAKEQFLAPEPAENRTNWRNKLVFHCRNGKTGYIARDNESFFPVPRCLLGKKELQELSFDIPRDGKIELRHTAKDGTLAYVRSDAILTEKLGKYGEFSVCAGGFFQINPPMMEKMLDFVIQYWQQNNIKKLLELYCGVGVFSISAASCIPDLQSFGIELAANAIVCAKANALRHNTAGRTRFAARKAEEKFIRQARKLGKELSVLVDPPRTGLKSEVIKQLLELEPEQIIYVSCGPDTLARDLDLLCSKYRVSKAKLFDFFPSTSCFETCVCLEKL